MAGRTQRAARQRQALHRQPGPRGRPRCAAGTAHRRGWRGLVRRPGEDRDPRNHRLVARSKVSLRPRNRTLQMRTRLPVPPHSGNARPQITIRAFASGGERGRRQIFTRAIEGLTAAEYDHRQRAAWAGAATDIAAWNARIQRLRPFIAMRGDVMAGYADLQADGL